MHTDRNIGHLRLLIAERLGLPVPGDYLGRQHDRYPQNRRILNPDHGRRYSVGHDTSRKCYEFPNGVWFLAWNGKQLSGGYRTPEQAQEVCDAHNADPECLAMLRTVRFWIYWQNSWVWMTLNPGDEVKLSHYRREDEGNSWRYETLIHDGHRVHRKWGHGGRDCDGPIATHGEDYCLFENLHLPSHVQPEYGPPDGRGPKWEEECETEVNDAFARAAGY